jgi:FKBP12-rapamycin complex-associated protein
MATTVGSAVTPAQQQVVQRLVADLRSRTEETRHKAARDLFNYVSVDLREIPADNLNAVLDFITKHMLDTVKGDASAKLGGVLAIVALINALDLVDVCKTDTRISRFGNFLCNTCLASATDPAVIELAAKALARLTQVSGTDTANLKFQIIAHEVKRAFEVLQGPSQVGSVSSSGSQSQGGDLQRGDMRRYAAVLVLREIACCMPTFFFQNVSTFFDVIFNAIRDPRPALRESAVYALRAALIVTTQRETAKQSKHQHEVSIF